MHLFSDDFKLKYFKINHISKTKNREIVKFIANYFSGHSASFETIFFQTFLIILNPRAKNRKIYLSFVSKLCGTYWTKKLPLFEWEGICMSLTRTEPKPFQNLVNPTKFRL